ncbi:MAG: phosphoadenylyl-sulfate reductase [bacterium]
MANTFVSEKQACFETLDLTSIVTQLLEVFGEDVVLASSLSMEDQVLTYELLKQQPNASIFVLDTGRLHQETYDVMQETMSKYNFSYQVYFPDQLAIQKMVAEKGPNLFYESIENRKQCCQLRKIEPLSRALEGKKAWMTGLRSEQSVTRHQLSVLNWDDQYDMVKVNPLLHWTTTAVWEFIESHDIPYNRLHKKGFPSIGCAPCTRAVPDGDDFRSGRWWWEDPKQRECGLHVGSKKEGKE